MEGEGNAIVITGKTLKPFDRDVDEDLVAFPQAVDAVGADFELNFQGRHSRFSALHVVLPDALSGDLTSVYFAIAFRNCECITMFI